MNHQASNCYTWKLETYDQQGQLFIRFGTDAPFRLHQGKIVVYNKTEFPLDPNADVKTYEWDENNSPWDTGLPSGKGWHYAWIAENHSRQYIYIAKGITEKSMNPQTT